MKTFAICAVAGGLSFVLMGYQMGLFGDGPVLQDETSIPQEELKPVKRAKFPQDLAPAARALPVPGAAVFDPNAKTFQIVILKTNGAVYEDWQERLNEGWAAESVEKTQLAIVLGVPRESYVDTMHYRGAPPIKRYRNELEVSVIEAKTGKVRANRLFVNVPRPIRQVETWARTKIGQPVAFRTVYNWAVSSARADFPEVSNPDPIVTVAE